jgi:hypothetical protein
LLFGLFSFGQLARPHFICVEHQRRMLLSGLNQSTQSLASMMPSLIEEFMNDYEDERQDATDNCK